MSCFRCLVKLNWGSLTLKLFRMTAWYWATVMPSFIYLFILNPEQFGFPLKILLLPLRVVLETIRILKSRRSFKLMLAIFSLVYFILRPLRSKKRWAILAVLAKPHECAQLHWDLSILNYHPFLDQW